jgi:hypothetical protein
MANVQCANIECANNLRTGNNDLITNDSSRTLNKKQGILNIGVTTNDC